MTDSRRPSLALSLVAVAAAASLTGCSYFSPTQTESPYAPSDGVEVALSNDVQVQNLLLVGSAKGESGTLSGYAVNSTAAPVDISFAGADGATPIKATIPRARAST
ncbi:hypothetical protein [Arsenicicoccus piscis]|uniref:Uncharacterized protein n=1 Tax=Arsenicicoccus piscis TaxID=673954 RepID=A0ABQ6HT88_9MICO|nr:hypothetical protein [Arsenicicoccus piscis]GMA20775.1 hypothetical protein GCM10025862_27960 [Arsenicicoccus piscis]